jgi:rhodanese-related sulfurtransferase
MKLAVVGVVIVAILIGLLAWQQAGQASDKTFAGIQQKMDKGAQLIDVRVKDEYDAGHIQGAVSLSLQDIESGSTPNVSKDTPIYVYCRSGNRAAQAKQILENAGFTNITNLGGMNDVTAIGGKAVLD